MLPRVLEIEVMDTESEAVDYDAMDHSAVNRLFVEDFLAAWQCVCDGQTRTATVEFADVGTGTAQIPIELCRRFLPCRVTAVDLAAEMLKLAAKNVHEAGLDDRIRLELVDARRLPFEEEALDAVVSNSIVHHVADPRPIVAEMLRVLRPGGLLFVRDLMRPDDASTVDHLVSTYARDSNRHQQQMFRDSLNAALTLDEVKELLRSLGAPAEWVTQTSDRHWTVRGCR